MRWGRRGDTRDVGWVSLWVIRAEKQGPGAKQGKTSSHVFGGAIL